MSFHQHKYYTNNIQINSDAFQSPLILKIFFSHLADTVGAPEEFLMSEEPCGALMLSITAVSIFHYSSRLNFSFTHTQAERALRYLKSGTTTLGDDKGADKFSEANWYSQTQAYGVSVTKIGPKTWAKILKGAREVVNAKVPIRPGGTDERAQISAME
jgi:hypothetical protein